MKNKISKIVFSMILVSGLCLTGKAQTQTTFTKTISNDSIVITSSMGVRQVSVLCTSLTSGTVRGTGKLGARTSSTITLSQNQSVTIAANNSLSLTELSIVAPAGCTLAVICNGQ